MKLFLVGVGEKRKSDEEDGVVVKHRKQVDEEERKRVAVCAA